VKDYLRVRWRKRWPVIPVSIVVGVMWVARSLTVHDGKALGIVILLVCFNLIGILFPFRWGGEE
jgi:hypothetical protein